MTPIEFLREEFKNVKRTLDETLRYDFGPEQGFPYYTECEKRLSEIETAIATINDQDFKTIWSRLDELSRLASWILLIERSHLGEFSWPFSDELKRLATALLSEQDINGVQVEPLIHIVAEAEGYQIISESEVPTPSTGRPFVIIAFQRSLKRHALLHSIFGHELGHSALSSPTSSNILYSEVITALTEHGPMSNLTAANAWLHDGGAPQTVRDALDKYAVLTGDVFALNEDDRKSWIVELTCDLFGLLLFGPSFLAAHQALLLPYEPDPYAIDFIEWTHPPYAIRHRMLVRVMHLLQWNTPITDAANGEWHTIETEFLAHLLSDTYSGWASIFTDDQLQRAIDGVRIVFAPHGEVAYAPMAPEVLAALIERLSKRLPPIHAKIGEDGVPLLKNLSISQTLYAGWAYWLGRPHPAGVELMDFLTTNSLCDFALLQQCAINRALLSAVV